MSAYGDAESSSAPVISKTMRLACGSSEPGAEVQIVGYLYHAARMNDPDRDTRFLGRGGKNFRERLRRAQLGVPLGSNLTGGFDQLLFGDGGGALGNDGRADASNAGIFHD